MPNSITILVFAMNLQGYWVVINSGLPIVKQQRQVLLRETTLD
ncbi:MAG: hypothetical protein ACO3YP_10365 [bacterium]